MTHNDTKGAAQGVTAASGPDRFVLNRRSGILHTVPASESCNVDAIPGDQRVRAINGGPLRMKRRYRRDCSRCFRQ